MSKHISTQLLEKYCEKALSPAELIQVDDHLFECEACYQRVDLSRLPRFTLPAFDDSAGLHGESDHLPYEQMAAYVDDESDVFDREIVESHLEICARCAEEVRLLFKLKRQIELPTAPTEML